jgi:hypothetical protein
MISKTNLMERMNHFMKIIRMIRYSCIKIHHNSIKRFLNLANPPPTNKTNQGTPLNSTLPSKTKPNKTFQNPIPNTFSTK